MSRVPQRRRDESVFAPSTAEGIDVARQIMKRLNIEEDNLVEAAYIDLLEQKTAD